MLKRARELGAPIIMYDYLTGGYTANTSLAFYCRDNGLLRRIHRAMHAVIDRQRNHGILVYWPKHCACLVEITFTLKL